MPLAREYFPSDTIKLINRSEHLVVRGGKRGTTTALGVAEKYGAHTIGRHLVNQFPGQKTTTGARGIGVKFEDFRDRFLDAPENLSSAWAGKGEMAVVLCELLNSDIGQYALRQMDLGVGRVVVHYLNTGKLGGLFWGLAAQATFQESNILITPASEALVKVMLEKADGSPVIDAKTGFQKAIMKKVVTPKSAKAQVKAKDIIAVNAVLDRFDQGAGLHLQTFFPSSEPVSDYCEWGVGVVKFVACQKTPRGPIDMTMLPRAN